MKEAIEGSKSIAKGHALQNAGISVSLTELKNIHMRYSLLR